MEIEEKPYGDVVVLSLRGKLTSEEETETFRSAVHSLLRKEVRKVVIDVEKVDYISSKGLGAIIGALTSMKKSGGDLCIANTAEKTRPLFLATQLVKVLKLYDSVDRAVSSLE